MPHIYGTRLTEAKQRIYDRVLENRYFGGQILHWKTWPEVFDKPEWRDLVEHPKYKNETQKRHPLKEDYFNLKGYLV